MKAKDSRRLTQEQRARRRVQELLKKLNEHAQEEDPYADLHEVARRLDYRNRSPGARGDA